MSFIWRSGRGKDKWFPMTASTAVTKQGLATTTTGQLVAVTAGTTAANILGIFSKTAATTDTDYATAGRLFPVWVPTERHALLEFDVTSGLVVGDIGTEVDLTDYNTVNRGASSIKAVKITDVISTIKGKGWVKFNGAY